MFTVPSQYHGVTNLLSIFINSIDFIREISFRWLAYTVIFCVCFLFCFVCYACLQRCLGMGVCCRKMCVCGMCVDAHACRGQGTTLSALPFYSLTYFLKAKLWWNQELHLVGSKSQWSPPNTDITGVHTQAKLFLKIYYLCIMYMYMFT